MGTKTLWLGVMAVLMVGVLTVSAQDQPARQRGGGGGDGQPRQFDREAFAQRMADRMKERLDVTDEEWAVISPRLEKVNELRREAGNGFGRGGFGGFGGRRNRGGNDGGERPERPALPDDAPATMKLSVKLNELLDDAKTDPAVLKQTLADLRAARAAAQKNLEAAQASLRELLTLRQEAVLVSMGVLE